MKVTLQHLTKKFPNRNKKAGGDVVAVNDFTFEIPDGKLIGLLGPSGCGKSTALNLISGLLEPTAGQIFFGEDDVTHLPPENRGVGLVFQNYALYPHMTVFENMGQWYCVWAEKVSVGKKISNLYIARMDSPTSLATEQVLLTSPDYDWERVDFWVNEGPAVVHHDGKIYLTYSASATGECYCMGMLSIEETEDLLNPRAWKKERYPVLKTDAERGIYGPGHNSFVKSEDGKEDIMIYHARPYDEIIGDPLYDPNRHAYRMRIKWNEQGRPVFDYCNNY